MKFSHRFWAAALSVALLGSACFRPIDADAAKKRKPTAAEIAAAEQAEQERQEAYNKTIDSNQIEGWPQGPQIYAESAIVMEADTGTILYNKDMDMVNYPASITKIMTALVALEHSSLDEVVTYSYYATHSIEAGSSSIGRTEGEELTVEESLYALLLASANECGNALAEHVSGSVEAFVELMNEKAAELGCTNTHFVNPHGLHDDNHYTTAHDMALIMKAALQNENFARICGTDIYNLRTTNKSDEIVYMKNHHYMIGPYKGVTKYLDDTVIAGKTGYTSNAKYTLVTAAERGGMTFIAVTMRTGSAPNSSEPGGLYFPDTALLLDYASENFSKVNVAANETNFSVEGSGFFHTGSSIFGQTDPLIEINKNDYIILPNDISFTEAAPELVFQSEENSDIIATLSYTWQGQPVGSASIELAKPLVQEFSFDRNTDDPEDIVEEETEAAPKKFIRINIRLILTFAAVVAAAALIYLLIRQLMKIFNLSLNTENLRRRFRLRKRVRRKKRPRPKKRYKRTPKKRESPYNELDL